MMILSMVMIPSASESHTTLPNEFENQLVFGILVCCFSLVSVVMCFTQNCPSMENAGISALIEIWQRAGGVERINETHALKGAASYLKERKGEMAEMQRRLLHLLTQLMKKGIVLSCVSEVVGVEEERRKAAAQERREDVSFPSLSQSSVDALNDEIDLFLAAARRQHVTPPTTQTENGPQTQKLLRANAQLKEENSLLRREIEHLRMLMKDSSLGWKITRNLSETVVKIPNRTITRTEGNTIHNTNDSWETIIVGNRMQTVSVQHSLRIYQCILLLSSLTSTTFCIY